MYKFCPATALAPDLVGPPFRVVPELQVAEELSPGKPAAAFTAGSGQHSGLEMTLLQMLHWMLACGMVVVGLPWGERMRNSGSYYGATAVGDVTDEDLFQARELGARLAAVTAKLTEG